MNFEDVFTFSNYYKASRKCRLGVTWKPSIQRYLHTELRKNSETFKSLYSGKYKEKPFMEFDIQERGKIRHIQSVSILDRPTQKCLTENGLIPTIRPKLIYDNSACLKKKGVQFSRNRLKCHLQKYYRHYGSDGWVLLFDFKSYFASIPHDKLIDQIKHTIDDVKIVDLYSRLVYDFDGKNGLGLGSQISQISAIFYLNGIDHYLKERMYAKYYGRYMDDGYIISNDKSFLRQCKETISKMAIGLGIDINFHKTQIVKLSKGFNFLKRKWLLTDTGKIIQSASKQSIVRQRRRINKFAKHNEITINSKVQSQQAWIASLNGCKAYYQIQNMNLLFRRKIWQT